MTIRRSGRDRRPSPSLLRQRRVHRRIHRRVEHLIRRHARSARELLQISHRRWYLVAPVLLIWTLACLRLFVDPTPRLPLLFNWTPSLPYHVAWMRLGPRTPHRGDFIVYAFAGGGTPKRDAPRSRGYHAPHDPNDPHGKQGNHGAHSVHGDKDNGGDQGGQGGQGGQASRGDEIRHSNQSPAPGSQIDAYPGLRGQPIFKRVSGVPGDRITVLDRLVLVNGEPMGLAKTHTHDRRPLTPIAARTIPEGQFFVQGTSDDSFDSRYRESGLVKQEQIVALVSPLF